MEEQLITDATSIRKMAKYRTNHVAQKLHSPWMVGPERLGGCGVFEKHASRR